MCPGCFHGDSSRAPWLHEKRCYEAVQLCVDCPKSVSLPMQLGDQKGHTGNCNNKNNTK